MTLQSTIVTNLFSAVVTFLVHLPTQATKLFSYLTSCLPTLSKPTFDFDYTSVLKIDESDASLASTSRSTPLLLGHYSAEFLYQRLADAGITERLAQLGYNCLRICLDTTDPFVHRVLVTDDSLLLSGTGPPQFNAAPLAPPVASARSQALSISCVYPHMGFPLGSRPLFHVTPHNYLIDLSIRKTELLWAHLRCFHQIITEYSHPSAAADSISSRPRRGTPPYLIPYPPARPPTPPSAPSPAHNSETQYPQGFPGTPTSRPSRWPTPPEHAPATSATILGVRPASPPASPPSPRPVVPGAPSSTWDSPAVPEVPPLRLDAPPCSPHDTPKQPTPRPGPGPKSPGLEPASGPLVESLPSSTADSHSPAIGPSSPPPLPLPPPPPPPPPPASVLAPFLPPFTGATSDATGTSVTQTERPEAAVPGGPSSTPAESPAGIAEPSASAHQAELPQPEAAREWPPKDRLKVVRDMMMRHFGDDPLRVVVIEYLQMQNPRSSEQMTRQAPATPPSSTPATPAPSTLSSVPPGPGDVPSAAPSPTPSASAPGTPTISPPLVPSPPLLPTPKRSLMPGQRYPGLGIGNSVFRIISELAVKCQLDALINVPEHFSNAYLYRRSFHFLNPLFEGFLNELCASLVADIARFQLGPMSYCVDGGFIIDRASLTPDALLSTPDPASLPPWDMSRSERSMPWDPEEMAFPLSPRMRSFLADPLYPRLASLVQCSRAENSASSWWTHLPVPLVAALGPMVPGGLPNFAVYGSQASAAITGWATSIRQHAPSSDQALAFLGSLTERSRAFLGSMVAGPAAPRPAQPDQAAPDGASQGAATETLAPYSLVTAAPQDPAPPQEPPASCIPGGAPAPIVAPITEVVLPGPTVPPGDATPPSDRAGSPVSTCPSDDVRAESRPAPGDSPIRAPSPDSMSILSAPAPSPDSMSILSAPTPVAVASSAPVVPALFPAAPASAAASPVPPPQPVGSAEPSLSSSPSPVVMDNFRFVVDWVRVAHDLRWLFGPALDPLRIASPPPAILPPPPPLGTLPPPSPVSRSPSPLAPSRSLSSLSAPAPTPTPSPPLGSSPAFTPPPDAVLLPNSISVTLLS
ncbi:hypothetical protein PAPYR_4938 [Paratrimastix pyriformis]|uniref:Uncharacterized protein n=1 Tax=Paratrimastix pyriformis TaxID=342808 RepID=A0ABQ8ULL4_9EUKA|nr:hypothetical protein PAPYR_4938 [Paratrimastix pyriformis]|eukprot:GAFH01000741.1.p1 GENE.GAFH01000741.1~~GAFH01000741.1.p1  ORF type:complete len:1093 (+),score=111.49 GAFH01000741.1:59-3337(+)